MPDEYIWVVTDAALPAAPEPTTTGGRDQAYVPNPYQTSPQRQPSAAQAGRVAVSAEKLEQGLRDFLRVTGRVLRHSIDSAGDLVGMELEEIEVTVEVNAEGEISLMGSGVKTGGKGAMTLKFKKASPILDS